MAEPVNGLTRRGLIGAGAAVGAAAVLPAEVEARRRTVHEVDVVVVGAGLSGLAAATKLVRAGKSVAVLEARDRVGGRTLNHRVSHGQAVEAGGQWIGPTQDRIRAIARGLGIKEYKTYNQGKAVYYRKGKRILFDSTSPVPPDADAGEVIRLTLQLEAMGQKISRTAPWRSPNARALDSQTFETWLDANAKTEGGRFLTTLGINAVFACEPRDISLLHVLFYISSAGNEKTPGSFLRLLSTEGGAQERRFVGGSQLVSIRLAKRLGRRVVLEAPVRRISQHRGRATVVSDRGTWHAKQVIVTGPPSVSAFIDYDPLLPAPRAQLLQRFPQGNAIKCEAVYRTPFWREQGLSGYVNADTGPVKLMYDNTPHAGRPGVLLGFIEAHEARKWGERSGASRRAAVLKNFATYIGPRAGHPVSYFDKDWSHEGWTRGCYVGFTPPGVLLDFGSALRRPHGRIHWAGAEYSPIWNGYMDGAVRSGEDAAGKAIKKL